MRGADNVVTPDKSALRPGRLNSVYIESYARELPTVEGGGGGLLVEKPASRAVHNAGSGAHPGDLLRPNQACRLGCFRNMETDVVGLNEKLVQRHRLHTSFLGRLRRNKRIVGDHVHAQVTGQPRHR